MITEIEISKSDRAICKGCDKKIGIETPRGVETEVRNGHPESHYFCYKCSGLKLDRDIDFVVKEVKSLKKELKKMIRKQSKAIILQELGG